MNPRHGLTIVQPEAEPAQEPPKDIYAEARRAALDSERWRKMHERSDRSAAISLPERLRRRFRGPGIRRARGGAKIEDIG